MITSTHSIEYESGRMKFNNNVEFTFTILGMAAGFGSVWRFPYLIFKNGGGAFLIPYLLCFFVIGIPLFYYELAIGQMGQASLPLLFSSKHPKFKGVGLLGIFQCFHISSYYNLLMAYSLYFLFSSFSYPVPWMNDSFQDLSGTYFYREVLKNSGENTGGGSIHWLLLCCYVFSLFLVFMCIKFQNGIQTTGKVAIYTASAPYVILMILLIRGLFLEGSSTGIAYLFKPDLSKIFDISVWVDAALVIQCFFVLGLGATQLPLYGSYRKRNDSIITFAIIVPLLTLACGILASLVVFCYIGFIHVQTNIPIDELPIAGPQLAFILYPEILTQLPFTNLLSIIFFLMMILLGIDSQFAMVDAISGTLEDLYQGNFTIFGKVLNVTQMRGFFCFSS